MVRDLLLVDGDLSFDHDILIVDNDYAILQSAIENIKIAYGEIPINGERGNHLYDKRMKLTNVNLREVMVDCKRAILYDTRVKDVPYLVAKKNGLINCDVTFILTTVDGLNIQGSTTIGLI